MAVNRSHEKFTKKNLVDWRKSFQNVRADRSISGSIILFFTFLITFSDICNENVKRKL